MTPLKPDRRPSVLLVLFLGAGLFSWMFSSRLEAGSAAELRALTGAQTRVVWIQDAGETACVYSERPTLRLMGLDTDDGKGERALLPAIARYWRPIITDDGTRVMFGDLEKKTVNIVNWDGGGLRTVLKNAHFEDVWTDPRDGVEWFYAKVGERRGTETVGAIRRYRLDDPSISELVWDKTPIFNFMVDGDGGAASGGISDGGNTPQGIFTLPNGDFYQRAGGCWPSMAPDNSLRSWVFTGNHRSIHFAVTTNGSGRGYTYTVEFNKSPGLTVSGREELYHPRWSNDVRFLTATAPLYNWSYRAEAKIPNDVAARVEIYLGKFTPDMKGVERWVKVTDNNRGDYWPDAWIKQPPGPPAWLASSPVVVDGKAGAKAKPDSTAQVFLWDTGNDGNQLKDAATGSIRQCTGLFRDAARYGRDYVMDLTGGAFVPEATAGPWLDAVKTGGAFSIEAVLTPTAEPPSGEGVVVAFADGLDTGNVVLSRKNGLLTLRLHGRAAPLPLVRLPFGRASHVIVSYAPGKLGVFVDGRRVLLADAPDVPVAGWSEQPLILGDAWRGGSNWPGLMEGIGLFGREIEAPEARRRFEAWRERCAGRKETAGRVIVEARLTGVCPPADPQGIAPYKRCLSVQQYAVVKVIEGSLTDKVIDVAQWSVLDGRVVPDYLKLKAGQTCRLALERWADHPEQESERMISGDFEEGALFYQVREITPPAEIANTGAPAAVPAAAAWKPVPGQADLRRLAGSLRIDGEENPRLFSAEPGVRLDTAGRDVIVENGSLGEVINGGSLRLGGAGRVTAAVVVAGGGHYTGAPALRLSGGGGRGASALATMAVTDLEITRLGGGYTGVPSVVIAPPDIYGGRQAIAVAEIGKDNGALVRLRIIDPGSGYVRAPLVTIEGGGGSGGAARATLSVAGVFVLHGGEGYTTPPVATLAGDGEGAVVRTVLQRTVLRYTAANGSALLKNTGTIDQDGAAILFDWAATQNNTGSRGIDNAGVWVMNNGALIQFDSSTGRPFWGVKILNEGTLRLLAGARIGLQNLRNDGLLQLGAGAMLGQVEYAMGDGTLTNTGRIQVAGGTAGFGLANPSRTGNRIIGNGAKDGSARASFTIGDGRDAAVFRVVGGEVEFANHAGSTTAIEPGATLELITNDNGSRHLFNNRKAVLDNAGDLLLAGIVRVQGNHAGFTGIGNRGRLLIQGEKAGVERRPSSAGPGAFYKAEVNSSQLLNFAGGTIRGTGTFTYTNRTGSGEAGYLRLTNLGCISPGGDRPGPLAFTNVNMRFGSVAAPAAGGRKEAPPLEGAGLLRILIAGPADYGSLRVSGGEGSGHFELTKGPANALDVVIAGGGVAPHGKYRIVTATAVTGTFAVLRFNGKSPAPYSVNYLPDGIEVVFP